MARNREDRSIPIDPLPSTQEPYVRIIAPNLDRISRDTFKRGTVERGRAIRGLIVLGCAIGLMVIVGIVGPLIASLTN